MESNYISIIFPSIS